MARTKINDSGKPDSKWLIVRNSPVHGYGCFARRDIKKGTRLIQYRGQLRTHKEVDRVYADDVDTGHTFLFTLNERYIIDANVDGNTARWINHSCAPNCRAVVEESASGDPRRDKVKIEAIRHIKPGDELTYDYGITLDVPHTAKMKKVWACRCGAKNCIGTMLKPKR